MQIRRRSVSTHLQMSLLLENKLNIKKLTVNGFNINVHAIDMISLFVVHDFY